VTDRQHQEGHKHQEQQQHQGNGRAVSSQGHPQREHAPGQQVQTQAIVQILRTIRIRTVTIQETQTIHVDGSKGHPETTIRRESHGTEGVTSLEFPHTSQQLY